MIYLSYILYSSSLYLSAVSGGESGSADTVRDPRGFALKLYTEEGNWDLVGNNTPIFFIRDPILVCRCVCMYVCLCVCVWNVSVSGRHVT